MTKIVLVSHAVPFLGLVVKHVKFCCHYETFYTYINVESHHPQEH